MGSKIILSKIDIQRLIQDGIKNWFQLGLKYVPTWDENSYEAEIVNTKKWTEHKKKYGFE